MPALNFAMRFQPALLAAAFLAALCGAATPAHAQARSYAVMSLVGNTLHIHAVRPAVGSRTEANSHHVLDVDAKVFDLTALQAANSALKTVQPSARTVLMMTDDAALYQAQNAMFDAPEANKDNRDYLISLLKDRGVSHLLLITRQRDHAYFKLTNGSSGSGQLEGLGFYIDDTTRFIDTQNQDRSQGMVGPFAYAKIRLLDAGNLAVLADAKATQSSIIARSSAEPSAMDLWESLTPSAKTDHINGLLDTAVRKAVTALLGQ